MNNNYNEEEEKQISSILTPRRNGVLFLDTEEDRLKTDVDEKHKKEEESKNFLQESQRPIINTNNIRHRHTKSLKDFIKNIFAPVFKRQKKNEPTSPLFETTSPRKSIMKGMFVRKKPKLDQNLFPSSEPTPERIRYLWGIARKKVYYGIKFVEGSKYNFLKIVKKKKF